MGDKYVKIFKFIRNINQMKIKVVPCTYQIDRDKCK